jgi:cyclopropane fatty-acyl-phospholipid synthase-like methyltransferase
VSPAAISPIAFPLTAKYDPQWIRDNALGENALCQAESLARRLPFRAGMRILDLGCGKAISSIFLAREFGVQAWAVDGATSPARITSVPSPSGVRRASFRYG